MDEQITDAQEVDISETEELVSPPVDQYVLSQKDYRPTPFVGTTWEIIGEQIAERNFMSMELEVLLDERAAADPMFESFDTTAAICKDTSSFFLPGGELPQQPGEVEETFSVSEVLESEEFQQLLKQKYEEGHAAGFAEGVAQESARVAEHYETLSARSQALTDSIGEQLNGVFATLEKRAFDLSIQIAEKVVHTTIELKPEYILQVIRKAIGSLNAAKALKIRVSHQDYEFLEVIGLPPEISETELGVAYVADDSISGGCIVETDFGEVNLDIESMWQEVRKAIEASVG
jgi:flagellar assembly protein FliH